MQNDVTGKKTLILQITENERLIFDLSRYTKDIFKFAILSCALNIVIGVKGATLV